MRNALRRRILETAYRAGEGHIASALSIVDIVWTLYNEVMTDGDHFVLSKGHGCLALYAVLEAKYALPIDGYCKPGSPLAGHPSRDAGGMIEFSTGSLGHGLPAAVGMAYAKKINDEPGRVFCLVGDGEMQEGSALEALRLVQLLDVSNLCLIVDANGSHGKPTPLIALLRGLQFHVRIRDGHEAGLSPALGNYSTYPVALIALTTKGKGVKAMERDPAAWHRRVPTADEYRQMMEELA